MTAGTRQLALDWEPGLVEQWPGDDGFADLCSAAVHASRASVEGLAVACDRSPSLVSRQLNGHREDDPNARRHFPLGDLPKLLRVTGDMRPLLRLVEEFLDDSSTVDECDRCINDLLGQLAKLQEKRARAARRGAK